MPCPSLRPVLSQAWPNSLVRDWKLASHSSPLSAGASPETYGRAPSASAAGPVATTLARWHMGLRQREI